MAVQLISVPYNLGRYNFGTGSGPTHFVENGAKRALVEAGHEVIGCRVDFKGAVAHEIGAAMAVNQTLAEKIRLAIDANRFPLVLAGNCNNCVGAIAALGDPDLGLIWFDAHGDFHTPETTRSGLFEGFPLSMAVGQSWQRLAGTVSGFTPVREPNVVLVGVRDLDAGEEELVYASSMRVCTYAEIAAHGVGCLSDHLDALERRTDRVYVHLDLDVLDPERAPWNEFSPPLGLQPGQVLEALDMISSRFDVVLGVLASYDPNQDLEEKALAVGLEVLVKVAGLGDR